MLKLETRETLHDPHCGVLGFEWHCGLQFILHPTCPWYVGDNIFTRNQSESVSSVLAFLNPGAGGRKSEIIHLYHLYILAAKLVMVMMIMMMMMMGDRISFGG